MISINLQRKFIEVTLWHGCSPVDLLHIFSTPFLEAASVCMTKGEAVVRRCSLKTLLLESSRNSEENTCARHSFLIKLQAEAYNFVEKENLAQVFSCKFWEISSNTFSYRTPPEVAWQRTEAYLRPCQTTPMKYCKQKVHGKKPLRVYSLQNSLATCSEINSLSVAKFTLFKSFLLLDAKFTRYLLQSSRS